MLGSLELGKTHAKNHIHSELRTSWALSVFGRVEVRDTVHLSLPESPETPAIYKSQKMEDPNGEVRRMSV